jgi:stringent starvation protein B
MTGVLRLSRRPYLLRAMHQWMTDSGLTPYVMVDATLEGVDVPRAQVRDGQIVLNISYDATRNLDVSGEELRFEARFAGVARNVRVPMPAVLSIYAKETGEGIVFPPEDSSTPPPRPADDGRASASAAASPPSRRPTLKVVK